MHLGSGIDERQGDIYCIRVKCVDLDSEEGSESSSYSNVTVKEKIKLTQHVLHVVMGSTKMTYARTVNNMKITGSMVDGKAVYSLPR
jgi:uncharacterized cysteine cluster protein YcgN (CxxCxxCC family)